MAQSKIIITEIAPSESGDTRDWIEFFVLQGPINLKNFTVFEGNAKIKTFGDIELQNGDYFVLNLDKASMSDDVEKNEYGYFDFYSSDTGLTSTKNKITIKDDSDIIIDELCFENAIGTYPSAIFLENTISKGQSISRKYDSNIEPINTNSPNDWEIKNKQSKGSANRVLVPNLKILITEIAPNESDNTRDWIEFFVLEGLGSIKDFSVFEGNSIRKTFSDINVKKGDYFVLNFKSELEDDSEKNSNGYYDFYSTNNGLTATTSSIKLYNNNGDLIDEVSYTNKNYNGIDFYLENPIEVGQSLSRKFLEYETPIDTNSVNDWEFTKKQTKGRSNKL
ncbi:MAG: hypothetical protein LBF97_04035, partial [Elusimicrobiota bacterium]|nr:hypothetical protein [Elusimicrobiota bacterium]